MLVMQDVKMVAWHPTGQVLVSASYDDTVKLWVDDGDEWVCQQTLTGAAGLKCSPALHTLCHAAFRTCGGHGIASNLA